MKNFRLSAILVIVLFVFTSCGLKTIKDEDRMVKETKEEAEQLFEYLKNEDIENLSSLFCQKKRDEHDLKNECEEFFEELDDKFVSYEKLETMVTQRTCYHGEIELMVVSVKFKNITMQSGKTYEEINYYTDTRNTNRPEKEGIGALGLIIGENEDGWIQLTIGVEKNTSEEYEDTQLCTVAKEEADQVFEYLREKDIQKLSSLFSENQKKNYDLEKEWNNFFEQIDGRIIDYETIDVIVSQRTFSDGTLTNLLLRIEFKNVKTDTGQVYEQIRYAKTARCNSEPDNEGINWTALIIGGYEKYIMIPAEE